ncbi:MAG: hypothetical protein VKJ64_01690 [Leptolyngbyaceae bacterium]|nr:hypothetical protein [Leptolyngbyaceae bacterium]
MTDIADRLIHQLNQHLDRAISPDHQADLHRATEGIETELSPLEIETLCNKAIALPLAEKRSPLFQEGSQLSKHDCLQIKGQLELGFRLGLIR